MGPRLLTLAAKERLGVESDPLFRGYCLKVILLDVFTSARALKPYLDPKGARGEKEIAILISVWDETSWDQP